MPTYQESNHGNIMPHITESAQHVQQEFNTFLATSIHGWGTGKTIWEAKSNLIKHTRIKEIDQIIYLYWGTPDICADLLNISATACVSLGEI